MPAAAAAPRVAPKLAAAAQAAVGTKKKKPAWKKRQDRATKHAGIRQNQRVDAFGKIQSKRVRAAGTMSRQRVSAAGQQQQQRVSATRQISLDKAQIRQDEYNARRAVAKKDARNKAIVGYAKQPFEKHDTVSVKGSAVQPIMLIIFTWAAIVIMYAMITSPNTSVGFFNSMRNWVGLLYQTKPMFTAIPDATKESS
jgi:hypothetical protein